jgi:hypothetical protein
MNTFKLKSWTEFFQPIVDGDKLHDLRCTKERDFRVGDTLILEEYNKNTGEYTGRRATATISFITSNRTPCAYSSSALDRGYAILSLKGATLIN